MEQPFYAYKTSLDEEGFAVTGNIEDTYGHYLGAKIWAESLDGAVEALAAKYPYAGGFRAA